MNADANVKPASQRRRLGAGYSMLELVLVVIVVGVLATVAMERFLFYQEQAEKAAMEATLAEVKMGLQMRLAELIVSNRQNLVGALEREDPMQWLDPPPANYAGPYAAPLKNGNWYYAQQNHELVYLPASAANLHIGNGKDKELRFRVVIRAETNVYTKIPTPSGVGLQPSRDFKWF